MSALPAPIRAPQLQLVDWSKWISAREAAPRLGRHPDSMTRLCRDDLEPRGLAMFSPGKDGGQVCWWVHHSYDARLLPGDLGELYDTPDLSRFTADQQREAWRRVEAVRRFREAREHDPRQIKLWLPELIAALKCDLEIKVSRSRLYEWDRLYKRRGDVGKLIDARGGDQYASGDDRAWGDFEARFLCDREPSKRTCWKQTKQAAKANGWAWCSYSTCLAYLDQKIPPEKQCFHRTPDKWRQQVKPGIQQDAEAWGAGELWESDHSQLDLWCRFGPRQSLIRPWITAWKDWRTRRIVGWVLSHSPNSSTILAALKMALRDPINMGGPDHVRVDNGKDYQCFLFHGPTKSQRIKARYLEKGYIDEPTFQGIFSLLGIRVHFTRPYNPNAKGRVERWFGTMHDQFDRSQPSYCGRNPEHRPESLKRVLARPALAPTFEEVRGQLADYIEAFNASADHQVADMIDEGGQKLSPDAALRGWCDRRRVMADPAALDLLDQHWHKPVRAGRNGIRIAPYGVGAYYGGMDERLSKYKPAPGKKAPLLNVSFDPEHPSSIRVWDMKMRFIGVFEQNARGGGRATDREAAKRLIKKQREYVKSLKFIGDNRELEYLSAAELLRIDAQEAAAPTSPPLEPSEISGVAGRLELVRTPLDGDSKEIQREQIRKAAGAEGLMLQSELPVVDLIGADETLAWPGADDDANDADLGLDLDLLG